MKKFFLFLAAVILPFAVFGGADEDAISKCILNFWQERGSLNIGKALTCCAPEFTEGPGEVNYRTLQDLAKHTDILLKSDDWEAVNESASMVFLGHLPNETSRSEAKKIKNTPAAGEKIAAVRREFEALQKRSAAGIKKITFANIAVSGAVALVELEGIKHIDTIHLKKSDGKWLITRTEKTDWKRKAAERKLAAEKAANEKAVTDVVTNHRKAALMLDLKKALSFCDSKYQELYGSGAAMDFAGVEKMATYMELMEKSDDLLVVMENALLLQGKSLSDIQRQKIADLVKKGEAPEIIAKVRENFRKLRNDGEKIAAGIKVTRITLKKDEAIAEIVTGDGTKPEKVFVNVYFLVKKSDKWLIRKVETVKN